MKAQIGFKMAVAALILGLTVMPGLARGVPAVAGVTAASGGFVWRTATVDSSGDRGAHTDIAFDPSSGTPWISYYDEGNKNLMVAHRVGSGGNCGPANDWYCETVDSAGDVGQNSSIDVYFNPAAHSLRVGVAYQADKALKFAEYSCSSTGTCFRSTVTIDQGDAGGLPGYGRYTSVKYNVTGWPHIAYYVVRWVGDIQVSELRFAYRRDTSGGNCGAGWWTCYVVNNGSSEYVSMEMTYAGSLLVPYIAYYNAGSGDLMLARYVGWGGGSGCTHASWSCQTIDSTGDVGQSVSLGLDSAGTPRLAYYDATNGKVKYAYRVWTGPGNCGGGNFQCITIGDAASPSDARSISLDVDSADNPLIAYRYTSGSVSQLRVAQPINAVGLSNGNCGPQYGSLYTWQCSTVDTASTLMESLASHVSAAFDPSDLPMVAYSRWAYTIGGGNYDLKIAYGRIGVFLPLVLRNSP